MFWLAGLMGVLISKITEKVKEQFPMLHGWQINALTWALGIGLALGFKIELVSALAAFTGQNPEFYPIADRVVTGLLLGSGSNYLFDITKMYGDRTDALVARNTIEAPPLFGTPTEPAAGAPWGHDDSYGAGG